MSDFLSILLTEDNLEDVELTLEALSQHNLANEVIVFRDGAETLDFLYCREQFSQPLKVGILNNVLIQGSAFSKLS
ncbi:MAG: hypothetical protein MPW14_19930 [Candidatus Manganitrophus sp.]|nr:hypothetical protein [Candidatus Manganitrophus sp.]MDC4225566.1 hypothetical protein [Candidatus Manganitrophus sp.]WDT73077.1 MAG: hypothetical protein MPW17_09615 [Candidatus Manganitrophus sp.]WDT79390.1 MAG: hypothetical protein MPW14_19930 [Candidatus Manganitrophus sp.]